MEQSETAPRLLRACRMEPVDATPIWMMRQAGRVLPAYRALRERHSFLDLVQQPDLMCEITLMPLKELDVDGAVMFADIMLPLASLGVTFELVESVGPVVSEPIRTAAQVDALRDDPVVEAVPAVFEALRLVRKEIDPRVPVIGFSGGPFTLACYLVEGRPSRDFSAAKSMMLGQPEVWDRLMRRLTDMICGYLAEKVAAGAQVLQLFDTWAGVLSPHDYEVSVLPYTREIFDRTAQLGVPRIHFGTNTAGFLESFASVDCDVVSVDWRLPLDEAWVRIGPGKGVQGNLDPGVLLAPPDVVRTRAREVLGRAAGRPGHIFNLGHGVLPSTPLDNLKVLVDAVREGAT